MSRADNVFLRHSIGVTVQLKDDRGVTECQSASRKTSVGTSPSGPNTTIPAGQDVEGFEHPTPTEIPRYFRDPQCQWRAQCKLALNDVTKATPDWKTARSSCLVESRSHKVWTTLLGCGGERVRKWRREAPSNRRQDCLSSYRAAILLGLW